MTALDTGTEDLRAEIDGGVAVITMNATHHVHTGLTEDHREAAQAFMDKREPRFHGR